MSPGDDIATEVDPRTQPSEPMAFELRVVQGPDAGASLRVEASNPTRVLIGKSPACQLVLQDPRISRRHVGLEISGARLRVSDLGSTNGTTVNGVEVTEAGLQGGEVLGLGDTILHVERRAAQMGRVTNAVQFGRLIGASIAMRRLYPLCERLAASNLPVVIEGESGTGKELLAEELHARGPRRSGAFVVFDCAGVAPSRADALLFGDAASDVRGFFESADGGTLLVDEIAELPIELQGKLLRAVERGEICRVGTDRWSRVDVRVIATTRRELEKEVEAGRFREDLYYRLAAERVELPPLRRRRGDEALLANFFTKQVDATAVLPPDFLRRYEGYAWPGNVRELQNAIARRLTLGDVHPDEDVEDMPEGAPPNAFGWMLEQDLPFSKARDTVLAEFEHQYVERVLAQHGGNVSRAAEASGLARRYFQVIRARVRR